MGKIKKEDVNKIKYGTISLPLVLVNKVKQRIKGTGMPSVSAYVAFVLRNILSKEAKNIDGNKNLFSERDKKSLKSRLKYLGYE